MLNFLQRLDRWVSITENAASILLLISIIVSTATGVFARYVLDNPLTWGPDVGTLSLVWLTFVGAGILFRHKGHIAASQLPDMVPPAMGIALRFLGELIVAISVGIVGWFGVVTAMVQSGQMISTLGVSRDLYSVPIVWMAVSMMIAILVKSLTRFARLSGAEAS